MQITFNFTQPKTGVNNNRVLQADISEQTLEPSDDTTWQHCM